jgi:hypothetical protein
VTVSIKPSYEVEGRSGERYQNISAASKVPKNTVASSFLNGISLEQPKLFLELAPGPN